MFEALKEETQSFFAARKKSKSSALGRVKNLKDVSSLALFFCVHSKEELKYIRNLVIRLRKPEKRVMAYVFYPGFQTLDLVTDKSIFFFNLNDFTLFAKMKENLDEKISTYTFELLISFVQTPNPICAYLLTEINANFKVGMKQADMDAIYNMTIKYELDNFQYQEFYDQVSHYLDVLNIESA